MNKKMKALIIGIVILTVSGCMQVPEEEEAVTPTVAVEPTTPVPASPIATTPPPATPAPTPEPTLNQLPPNTLYVTARMLKPAFWGTDNYELRAYQVTVTNQRNAPLSLNAQIITMGQVLEEKSFRLESSGSSYTFSNEKRYFINSTNLTLRLLVQDYQPIEQDFRIVETIT